MNVEAIKPFNSRWQHPCNVVVAGPSKSGKTRFIRKMIRHRTWKFDPPIKYVVYLYSIWQDEYDNMKKEFGDEVKWVKGLPDDPYALFKRTPGLLIADDLMGEMESDHRQISKWFTKGTHHMDVSLVVLMQNVFPAHMRTASLNAHRIVLFRNPRDKSQLQALARQAFPGQARWLNRALEEASKRPFRPLIMDFDQSTPDEYRLSLDPFPEDLKDSNKPFPQVILP